MTRSGLAMHVRMVVGEQDHVGLSNGADVVGTMLHPNREVIVGTVPGTPASKVAPAMLAEMLGLPWASESEIRALERAVGVSGKLQPADGRARTRAAGGGD